ncbi:MAG: fused MFS/spermidine synthase [Burkholderiales bacterium]|nr:fused MFS/spermidine synthase [Burkholderiales bacterium]
MASIEVSEERGVRYLHFGSELVLGAMRIARPWALELEYTRELMLPLLLRDNPGWPTRVLQIGLGAASITRFLHRNYPETRLTVVEIDPRVIATAQEFFKLPGESERLRIVVGDGHEFVAGHGARFDWIVVDGFDEKGRTGSLDTREFYSACRARLTARGMMSVNLLTRRRGVAASEGRMREVFGDNVLVLPPPEAGNTVAIVALEPPRAATFPDLREAASALRARTGLNLLPTLARLAR